MDIKSRFIKKTLMPDEKIEAIARLHILYLLSSFLWLLFFIFSGFMMQYLVNRYAVHIPFLWSMMIVWGMTAAGLLSALGTIIKYVSTEIILTSERLIHKRGLFVIDVAEVDVEQLASDTIHQSFLGRLFNYGTIYVRCIEAADFWLPAVARPYEFRNVLEQCKHAYREHYINPGRMYKKGEHSAH